MHIVNTPLGLIKVPAILLSWILDLGPVFFISISITPSLFLCWYFYEFAKQSREKRLWLMENAGLLMKYRLFTDHLEHLGQLTPGCSHCNDHKMQLWNHEKQQLLVVRCRSCKMTYTLTREHCKYTRFILSELDWAISLTNTLTHNRHKALGKFLIKTLALDPSCLRPDINPLEVFHFSSQELDHPETDSAKDIVLNEWEEVSPMATIELRVI